MNLYSAMKNFNAENSVSLCLCDKINTEAQRQRGTESLTFLTGLTGFIF